MRAATSRSSFFSTSISIFQSPQPMRAATPTSCFSDGFLIYFNPRSPCGLRPDSATIEAPNSKFQSPQPMRAATSTLCLMTHMSWNFNPRSPCGLRQIQREIGVFCLLFQSPQPMRAATLIRLYGCDLGIFQSPQPMRAATALCKQVSATFHISIPAAHAGCDFQQL